MAIFSNCSRKHVFPLRLYAVAFVISVFTTVFSGWQTWHIHHRVEALSDKRAALVEDAGSIMLFDEVLTMSARMAAATGDFNYEKRYDQFDSQLTREINELRALLPHAEIAQFVTETDEANNAQVKLERQAFTLAHQGQRQEALTVLSSTEYLRLKKVYASGMEKTINATTGIIERERQYLDLLSLWFEGISAISVLVLLATWFYTIKSARRWAVERRESEAMLCKARDELEVRVEQRTADLLSANEQLQHEITERKRNEERYRTLVENMNDGVAVYQAVDDGKDFVFLEYNQAGERIGKLSRDQVIGHRLTEVFSGVVVMGLLEVMQKVYRSGNPERLSNHHYQDKRVTLWVDNYIYRLPTGEIVAVYADITQRKQTESAISEQLEELRRWHETTLGREGRIIELKHEINQLLAQTGQPPRYPSAESQDPLKV